MRIVCLFVCLSPSTTSPTASPTALESRSTKIEVSTTANSETTQPNPLKFRLWVHLDRGYTTTSTPEAISPSKPSSSASPLPSRSKVNKIEVSTTHISETTWWILPKIGTQVDLNRGYTTPSSPEANSTSKPSSSASPNLEGKSPKLQIAWRQFIPKRLKIFHSKLVHKSTSTVGTWRRRHRKQFRPATARQAHHPSTTSRFDWRRTSSPTSTKFGMQIHRVKTHLHAEFQHPTSTPSPSSPSTASAPATTIKFWLFYYFWMPIIFLSLKDLIVLFTWLLIILRAGALKEPTPNLG